MRLLVFALALLAPAASAQTGPLPPGTRYAPGVDVEHYTVQVALADETDRVDVTTTVAFLALSDTTTVLPLDLVAARPDGMGMAVASVVVDGAAARYTHTGDRLTIRLPAATRAGAAHSAVVAYAGVPADGLVIGTNRHGGRTFFGDHWPNRARNWVASVDHPSDKARFTWVVTAPAHYQVIGNGRLVEVADGTGAAAGTRTTTYTTDRPLAPKIAVVGAARFAVEHRRPVPVGPGGAGVPSETWAYPEDHAAAFFDFAVGDSVAVWLAGLFGPYPYEKLAHVQSTTRYGGMENAAAIFYDENSVTGTARVEGTVVHELVHMWFGNLVSEADWPHLWLSEGFATYFTHDWTRHTRGEAAVREALRQDRARVVAFAGRQPQRMLVDTTYSDPNELLNAYSYQRGGWTLHLLERRLGHEAFLAGIRLYLGRHADGNAVTDDLRRALEEASGQDLRAFFAQWTRRPGVPRVEAAWRVERGQTVVTLRQAGAPWAFPLTVEATNAQGRTARTVAELSGAETVVRLPLAAVAVALDPDVEALAALVVVAP